MYRAFEFFWTWDPVEPKEIQWNRKGSTGKTCRTAETVSRTTTISRLPIRQSNLEAKKVVREQDALFKRENSLSGQSLSTRVNSLRRTVSIWKNFFFRISLGCKKMQRVHEFSKGEYLQRNRLFKVNTRINERNNLGNGNYGSHLGLPLKDPIWRINDRVWCIYKVAVGCGAGTLCYSVGYYQLDSFCSG